VREAVDGEPVLAARSISRPAASTCGSRAATAPP
jgi:hypothetical protein